MRFYCPLCNRTGEVDEVELAQFEREIQIKFLKECVTELPSKGITFCEQQIGNYLINKKEGLE